MSLEPTLHDSAAPDGRARRRRSLRSLFTTLLFLSAGCAAFLAYLFYAEGKKPPPPPAPPAIPSKVIQLDVLNGCGAKGAGGRFTDFLRASGFDVVELKNTPARVGKTIVVDRVGNLAAAKKVAAALGVSESNVVQQINPDYFVDVSVVIGADHATLNPGKTH